MAKEFQISFTMLTSLVAGAAFILGSAVNFAISSRSDLVSLQAHLDEMTEREDAFSDQVSRRLTLQESTVQEIRIDIAAIREERKGLVAGLEKWKTVVWDRVTILEERERELKIDFERQRADLTTRANFEQPTPMDTKP